MLEGMLEATWMVVLTISMAVHLQVRQGLKQFSNWPTYPQLYVNGSLIGGLDILKEMKVRTVLRSFMSCSEERLTFGCGRTC